LTNPDTILFSYGRNDFEWHLLKAASNERKHGVTFEEAATIFEDDLAVLLDDEDHSDDESRFVLLGLSEKRRLLSVAHIERGSRLRIISARLASGIERRDYDREAGVGV